MNVKEYIVEKKRMMLAGGACLLIAVVLEFLLFPAVYRVGIILISVLLALFIMAIAMAEELKTRTAKHELIIQDLQEMTKKPGYAVPEGGTLEEQELAKGVNHLSQYIESIRRESEQDRKDLADYVRVWTPKLEENLQEFRTIANSALRSDLPNLLERQVDQTNLVVQQLLYYLRTKTDGINSRKIPVSINDIALQTIKRYYPMMQGKRIGYLIKGQDVIINTDPDILSFAFGQVLHNAIKYSPRKSSIGIYIKHFRGNYYLMAEDKGMGISPSDQPRVFDKNFVGKNEADEASPGMGLYLAKSFIELLGYEIGLTSKPNQGTTVAICFTGAEARPRNGDPNRQPQTVDVNASENRPATAQPPQQQPQPVQPPQPQPESYPQPEEKMQPQPQPAEMTPPEPLARPTVPAPKIGAAGPVRKPFDADADDDSAIVASPPATETPVTGPERPEVTPGPEKTETAAVEVEKTDHRSDASGGQSSTIPMEIERFVPKKEKPLEDTAVAVPALENDHSDVVE